MKEEVQVGLRRGRSAQARIDDPAAGFDGRVVAEVVRRFENEPGRVDRGSVALNFAAAAAD